MKCQTIYSIRNVPHTILCTVSLDARSESRGDHCGGSGLRVLPQTAHVPGAERALQRPQHDNNKQHHEHDKEHHPLPVGQPVQQANSPRPRLDGRVHCLAGPNVNADAEGRGTVRGAVAVAFPGAIVAQLLPLNPHVLLLLLVSGQPAEDFAASGQSRGSLLGQCGGVTAEGAREVSAAAVLVSQRDGHEAGEALQAEGVGAVQQLGCFEDIVVGVVADGALWLADTDDRHLLLHLPSDVLRADLCVPNLRRLFHLQSSLPLDSLAFSLPLPSSVVNFWTIFKRERMKK